MRYERVAGEVQELKAKTVLEVGTWNGDRAIAMASARVGSFMYYGFDLFEDITPEKSKEEYNVKRSYRLDEVLERLRSWSRGDAKREAEVVFSLYKGNTRDSLPRFLEEQGEGCIDLAWIDGGHSVGTIESDFAVCKKLVRKGGVILLDDFYSDVPSSMTRKVGCNRLVGRLMKQKVDVQLLEEKDPVNDFTGERIGSVQIVRVQL